MSGSLTGATLTQIKMEKRNLRFVAIDGVEPSLANLENRTYHFAKTQYFVLPATPKPAAARFVEFLRSPAGQTALLANSNILIAN